MIWDSTTLWFLGKWNKRRQKKERKVKENTEVRGKEKVKEKKKPKIF